MGGEGVQLADVGVDDMIELLDRAGVQVGPGAGTKALALARSAAEHAPDAQLLAEALQLRMDYSVASIASTWQAPSNRKPAVSGGDPGDFQEWYRQRLAAGPSA